MLAVLFYLNYYIYQTTRVFAEATIDFTSVCGKCCVVYGDNLTCSENEFFLKGPHRFYFTQAYDPASKELTDPPREAINAGTSGKVWMVLFNLFQNFSV